MYIINMNNTTKICTVCLVHQELAEFPLVKGSLRSHCKQCARNYRKEYYEKNHKAELQKAKERNFVSSRYYKKHKKELDRQTEGTKVCTKCHILQEIAEFQLVHGKLRSSCKQCARNYRLENADAEKARNRERYFYKSNKEVIDAYNANLSKINKDNTHELRCYRIHTEAEKKRRASYGLTNRELAATRAKDYCNAKAIRAIRAFEWEKANPDKRNAINAKRYKCQTQSIQN